MHQCGCCQVAAFGFHLFFLSGFLSTFTEGDVCSCQQYTCNTCPLSGPCTRINMALGKTASASSLFNNTQHGASGPACLAVNGNTATTFIPANKTNPACVHTADGDVTPYWEVDLGGQYAISSITVYGRYETDRNMLRNATVTVDDKLCYSFAPDYYQPVITEITCSQHLTGSKVRIQKAYTYNLPFLGVCQVQVWVCNDSYYGPNCTNTCGRCSKDSCDPWSGECPQGCSAGYQAPDCKEHCKIGTYGANCNETCGNCTANTPCNIYDGRCETGCATGYKLPLCKECENANIGDDCASTHTSDTPTTNVPYSTESACSQSGDKDYESANTAGPVAGAVVGSVAGCIIGFLLGALFMRYRHRQGQDKISSTACFSAPLQKVHYPHTAGVISNELALPSDYENARVSTNVYDSLQASRDDAMYKSSDYTSLPPRKTGEINSSPYINTD